MSKLQYFKMKVVFLFILNVYFVQAEDSFQSFQIQHNKTYSATELTRRKQIFNKNLVKIQEHNEKYRQGLVSYQMGVNQFSDLTEEEFSSRFKTLPLNETLLKNTVRQDSSKFKISELPKSIDWRIRGIVTDVKNQGVCGACWAFSATGALEGQLALKNGTLVKLSEQQLIDCNAGSKGCNGGTVQSALSFATTNGLTTEENYPYTGRKANFCKQNYEIAVKADGYVNILPYNETDLKLAVGFVGPVSVAIDATPFQYYSSGIYPGIYCTNTVNHAVLIVGYGVTLTGQEYWIIKNSWGSSWGENGYFRLAMSENNIGFCGIGKQSCYPVLSSGYSFIQNVQILILGLVFVKMLF